MQGEIVEERITFANEDGLELVGVLAYPERAKPNHTVLLCSPHPHFAGNMDNNVICAMARGLARFPESLAFRKQLISVLARLDRHEDAYRHIEEALAFARDDVRLLREQAKCAYALERFDECIEACEKSRVVSPRDGFLATEHIRFQTS